MRIYNSIKNLLNYKDLFLVFVWKDFSVKYRPAVFGFAWAIIQPVSFMLLFTFIFSYVMPVKISSTPYPVFFYAGILPWTFFASSIAYAIQSITGNYFLIRKIYFPPILLPLSGIIIAFIDFLISSTVLVALLVYYKIPLSTAALWYIPLLFLLILFILSVSLTLSVLNAYYRDVGFLSNFLIQVMFFATPIIYSVDKITPSLKLLVFMNPLAFIIENMRRCLLEQRQVIVWQYAIMLMGLLVLLFLSYQFFKATERRFADVS